MIKFKFIEFELFCFMDLPAEQIKMVYEKESDHWLLVDPDDNSRNYWEDCPDIPKEDLYPDELPNAAREHGKFITNIVIESYKDLQESLNDGE